MSLAQRYDRLTPEERYRLLMAATMRGDDAERVGWGADEMTDTRNA